MLDGVDIAVLTFQGVDTTADALVIYSCDPQSDLFTNASWEKDVLPRLRNPTAVPLRVLRHNGYLQDAVSRKRAAGHFDVVLPLPSPYMRAPQVGTAKSPKKSKEEKSKEVKPETSDKTETPQEVQTRRSKTPPP